ncbi:MAG: hypothetical protein LBL49_03300, partial [Clostridiales Family XIII bacterium]|nr:hypothetical protein [Clostridiales Family XIII bacterium]
MKDYDAARARGDQAGMNAAHAMAVNARAASGKMRNNQTVNSSGYVVMKTSSTASGSSGNTSSSSSSTSRSRSSNTNSGSKTSNSITASIKDNLSLKPLTASASSNHPLINGDQIAEKDTNKISLSEVGDGVFSFISGAAGGVAASLSMGLSDIFVVKDDNKNETVYLVGRLVGAVVVAVVAVAVTAGSTAAAVGTSPTVVGSAVSVGSAVNAGGKVVSAVGVAGDAVSTIIANGKDNSAVGGSERFGPMNKGHLPDAIANTFCGGAYKEVLTQGETIFYRSYGGKAGEIGNFWTTEKPQGALQSVVDSALDQSWGNTATKVSIIRV